METVQTIMDAKLSKKDPTPFGVKSHLARYHLVSSPAALKRSIALGCVQASDRVQLKQLASQLVPPKENRTKQNH